MEAIGLLVTHVFNTYGLRKVYIETLEPHFELFASGQGTVFEVEARFAEYAFHRGRYVDKIVATIDREHWHAITGPLFERRE